MSVLARAPLLRQTVLRSSFAAPARNASHGTYQHIPFKTDNKPVFAIKVAAFLLTGFTLPAWAALYHIKKGGA